MSHVTHVHLNVDEFMQAVTDLELELEIDPLITQGPLAEEILRFFQHPSDFTEFKSGPAAGADSWVLLKVTDRYASLLSAVQTENRKHGIGVEQVV